jgi:hypothetical protein
MVGSTASTMALEAPLAFQGTSRSHVPWSAQHAPRELKSNCNIEQSNRNTNRTHVRLRFGPCEGIRNEQVRWAKLPSAPKAAFM